MCEEIKDIEMIDVEGCDEDLPYISPILISTENLVDIAEYDVEEFKRGLKDISYLAGKLTGLINAGLDMETVLTIISNEQNIQHNIEVAKINGEYNVRVAEKQKMVIENQQL